MLGLSHPLTTFRVHGQRASFSPQTLGCEPPVEEVRNGELGVASERAVEHGAQDRARCSFASSSGGRPCCTAGASRSSGRSWSSSKSTGEFAAYCLAASAPVTIPIMATALGARLRDLEALRNETAHRYLPFRCQIDLEYLTEAGGMPRSAELVSKDDHRRLVPLQPPAPVIPRASRSPSTVNAPHTSSCLMAALTALRLRFITLAIIPSDEGTSPTALRTWPRQKEPLGCESVGPVGWSAGY